MLPSKWISTAVGGVALLFWSLGAVLIAAIGKLPVFEIQFIVFLSSFFLSYCRISLNNRWHIIAKVPITMWLAGIVGIYLANLFFVTAFQHAPPEKVDLINYLWPVMVILFSPLLLNEKLKLRHLMGVIIAFSGIFILLTDGQGIKGFETKYCLGYGLSFLNALCWTIFIIYCKRYPESPNEMIGIFSGIAAVCSLVFHFLFESFIMPEPQQLILLIILGLTGQGLSYLFWDHAIKNGYYKFLCTLTYASPLVSIFLLVYFGFTPMSDNLIKATLLVSLGAAISMPPLKKGKKKSNTPAAIMD